ncbi:uS10 family ribosomal protein [Sutcliffiella rhizosphaerae]|uniref:Aminopeptidase n=1 Tax=Sutcliffiella rhizosphaerae TaxID=2880967 RepID=A0ABN8AB96_9BACI|nr:hypothetical protein [Sutcliffiella rhizosphaerae]CAG9622454.1 hypothetical protein BACCIP111883_03245 [Sutcliffiella rhizosphaerae]
MQIIDTVPFFLAKEKRTIPFLRSYYETYPAIFHEYFSYHCQDTEERHMTSLTKYPDSIPSILETHKRIVPIIQEVSQTFAELYKLDLPIGVNLIVGGYGSNAYTHKQVIPDITFALEKLSSDPDHLRVIVAHEFGHAAHNLLSDKAGTDWTKMAWNHPLIWINQEGAATHFSRNIIPDLKPSVYFSFNDEGEEWIEFASTHFSEIKKAFAKDVEQEDSGSIFREWFSIRGGLTFKNARLAYYIGDQFFQYQKKRLGEHTAIVAWKEKHFIEDVQEWLSR